MSWFEDLMKKLGPGLDCRTPKPGLGGAGISAARAYEPPTRVLAFPPPPEDVEWCVFMTRPSIPIWSTSIWGTTTIETVMVFSLKHDLNGRTAWAVGGRYTSGLLDRVGQPVIPRHYRTLEPSSKT